MIRSLIFISLLSFVTSCANQLPDNGTEFKAFEAPVYHAQYDRSALQNLKWLAGEWKGKGNGKETALSFLFHTNHLLEVLQSESGNLKASQFFSWKDGHYYFGQNRQWIITWISDKNIRFDPVVPGLKPMTWSRVHENEWHLLKHSDSGDEVTVMKRTDEMT